ncbi:TonB-dependent receptor [Flavobacterium akiainvivens]|uniref:TonB-dependent receptor n=2 Tax=Flavobacterium akiainvivens TaxID=1202724 RepID=A0A0M9VK31_9FLAO|nr:TonB-dependent receptor [Flavobacterium akiainvivens]
MEAQPKTIQVVVNKPRVEVAITIQKTDPKLLDELVMTKKTEKAEILSKGFSVNVIDTKEAATRNLQTNDLLDRSVGVRVRQNGGLGASVDYNLNGMSGNSVRVFIDGIPISTYGSSFNLNSIPPALIERIEVYKGVIPAHLADDALGGAINVILKKGAKNVVNASASYGSFNTIQSNFNTTFRAEKGFTVKASGFYNYSDNDYEVWGKFVYNILPNGRYEYIRAKRFNNMYRSYGGRIEAGYTDVKWADVFLLAYNGSADFNEIQHGQFMTKPYKGRFTEADAHAFSLNYAKKDFIAKGLDFNLNAVYSRRNEVVNDTVKWNYNWNGQPALGLYGDPVLSPTGAQQGAPTINHITRNVLSVRGGFNYNINEQHKIIFSNMFNTVDRDDYDEMKSALERTFQQTRDLQKSVSSLAYEMQVLESSLRTSLFGKYYSQSHEMRNPVIVNQNGQQTVVEDVSKNTTTTFGYGFAGSYFITPEVMVLASAERAVRMPSDGEIFGSPGENITPNPGLRPEISDNLNLGFRLGTYKIKKHNITVSASAFWRNTSDKIARQANDRVNDAIQTAPFVNLRESQSVGFEATLEYTYNNRLFITANTSKFNSLYKLKYDNNGNILPFYNQQLPNEPFFTVNANAQYNFKDIIQRESEFNVFYNLGYVDPFYTAWLKIDSTRTPAQMVHDLGLTYAFPGKKFVLGFDARNVTNRQVYDNYAVQKPGRAFYVKLNYTFGNF